PYYLGEHSNKNCHTVLQLVGTTISLGTFVRASLAALPLLLVKDRRLDVLRFGSEGWKSVAKLLLGGLVQGYVWAWIGHFFFEHNRPATFKHPFYSFVGDLTLWREVVTLQRKP
ncbi:SPOSA6832_00488, partial [Sporobolomyces salmonicolor]